MGKVYMMVAIAILPVIIVYLLLSKFIVRGVALGTARGRCFRFPHERPNEHSPYRRTNDSCNASPSPCDRQCSTAARKRITTVPDSPSIS